jgi:hypothetical protein
VVTACQRLLTGVRPVSGVGGSAIMAGGQSLHTGLPETKAPPAMYGEVRSCVVSATWRKASSCCMQAAMSSVL